jgi:hypothetical protein
MLTNLHKPGGDSTVHLVIALFPLGTPAGIKQRQSTTEIPMMLKKLLSSLPVATTGPLGGSGESAQRMFGGQK